MASLLVRRGVLPASRRMFHVSSVSAADKMMVDPTEHATGVEKYELLAKQAGNPDPFFLRAVNRDDPSAGAGTKADPVIVNAMDDHRMIGCICRPEVGPSHLDSILINPSALSVSCHSR